MLEIAQSQNECKRKENKMAEKKSTKNVVLSVREQKHVKLDSLIVSPTACKGLLRKLAAKNGGELPSMITRKEPRMINLNGEQYNLHGVALKCFGVGFAFDRPVKSELADAHENAKVRAYDETLIPLLTSRGYSVSVTPGQEARFGLPVPKVKAKSKPKAAVKAVEVK